MSRKKYNKTKTKGAGSSHEILGVMLIIISALLLLCIVIKPILGVFSEAIFGVMLGTFGIMSYPMLIATTMLGVYILKRRTPQVSGKIVAEIILLVVFTLIILQLATTHKFLDQSIAEYIDSVYDIKYSAGGIIFGLIAYGLSSLITEIACYVVFSMAILVVIGFMTSVYSKIGHLTFGKKNKQPEEEPRPELAVPTRPQRVFATPPQRGLADVRIVPGGDEITGETGSASGLDDNDRRRVGDYGPDPVTTTDNSPRSDAWYNLYGDRKERERNAARDFIRSQNGQSDYEQPQEPTEDPVVSQPYVEQEPAQAEPISPSERIEQDAQNMRRVDYDGTPNNLNQLFFPPEKKIEYNNNGIIENIDEMRPRKERNTVNAPVFDIQTRNAPVEPVEKIIDASQPLESQLLRAEDRFLQTLEGERRSASVEQPPVSAPPPPLETERFRPEPIIDADIETAMFGLPKDRKQSQPIVQEDILDGSLPYEEQPIGIRDDDDDGIIDASIPEPKPLAPTTVPGGFIIDDGPAIDMTERNFDNGDSFTGEDLTGMYVATGEDDDTEDEQPEKPVKPVKQKRGAPIENQVSIGDIFKGKADETVSQQKKYRKYNYTAPPIDLLKIYEKHDEAEDELANNSQILETVVSKFLKTDVKVVGVVPGPQVTRYELDVPLGTSVKGIETHVADIAYELSAMSGVRVEAPIPGKRAVGIEVPNKHKSIVGLREIVASPTFTKHKSPLLFSVGKDIGGDLVVCDLEKVPHLLIAGQTGSGKSAGLNSLIVSLLYKSSPEDLRFILIDPKRVEFSKFRGMPHLLFEKTITEPNEALNALKWAHSEMDRRYTVLQAAACSKLAEYNESASVRSGAASKLPHIIIIIDELANLMQSAVSNEIETEISSIAALARAAGIHLIVATQRPSADVITGTIKANLTSRIAFKVPDATNSRIILDVIGAEALAGDGDMLFYPQDAYAARRVQGSFVSGEEVLSVVCDLKDRYEPDFDEDAEKFVAGNKSGGGNGGGGGAPEIDPLAARIMAHALRTKQLSTSVIQRRFSIGYARAARIIDNMFDAGFIGEAPTGNKPRDVLMTEDQYREFFGHDPDDN